MNNLLLDLVVSAVLVAIALSIAAVIAKSQGLPLTPPLLVAPIFILVGLVLYHPLSPGFILMPDADSYLGRATDIANTWNGAEPIHERGPWPNKEFWSLIMASLIWAFGPLQIALIVFNSMVVSITATLLQWATYELTSRRDRYLIPAIFVSSSPMLLFGPALLREAIFWLGAALGILALLLALKKKYIVGTVILSLSIAVLLAIRPNFGMGLSYALVALFIIVTGVYSTPRTIWKLTASAVSLIALVFSAPSALEFVREDFGVSTVVTITDSLGDESVTTAFKPPPWSSTETTETTLCDLSTVTKMACSFAENSGSAFFGPFWWEVGPEPIWLISIASTLHFQALVLLTVLFFFGTPSKRIPTTFIVVIASFSVAVFSALLLNYGILIRFRAMTEILLIPTAIGGWFVVTEYLKKTNGAKQQRKTLSED